MSRQVLDYERRHWRARNQEEAAAIANRFLPTRRRQREGGFRRPPPELLAGKRGAAPRGRPS